MKNILFFIILAGMTAAPLYARKKQSYYEESPVETKNWRCGCTNAISSASDAFRVENAVKNNKYVIIKASMHDCPPCKKLAPIFKQLAVADKNKDVMFIEVDTDILSSFLGKKIQSVPKVFYYKNGKEFFPSNKDARSYEGIQQNIDELKKAK